MNIKSANILLVIALFCASFLSFSQDEGMLLLKDSDDNRIKFESRFYDALKYKAIGNYTRAITELEKCQQIVTDDVSIDFEFSKNYFMLNKYAEAALYIEKALNIESKNYWYLVQAKKVYLKQFDYSKAISVQKKMIILRPNLKEDLVLVYILANERREAQDLIDELISKGITSSKLRNYQKALLNYRNQNTAPKVVSTKNAPIEMLKESFKSKKQFDVLRAILMFEFSEENNIELLNFSEQGMELFPAQPLVYLMYGRSLNILKKYNEAIDVLNNGFDFIVDDMLLEADFYEELGKSYDGLNQPKNAKMNREKSSQLRKNK